MSWNTGAVQRMKSKGNGQQMTKHFKPLLEMLPISPPSNDRIIHDYSTVENRLMQKNKVCTTNLSLREHFVALGGRLSKRTFSPTIITSLMLIYV